VLRRLLPQQPVPQQPVHPSVVRRLPARLPFRHPRFPPRIRPSGAVAANGAVLRSRLEGLDLTPEQTQAILALSREVIERVVWEVVPVLAETLIKEEIQRLTRE
jgi:hypothetical protein